jgi:hypothetical protein
VIFYYVQNFVRFYIINWYHNIMKWKLSNKALFSSVFSVFIVLTLLFSLSLHSVQISHDHPGNHTGEQQGHGGDALVLGEYLHMSDKKLCIILASILLLGTGIATALYGNWPQFLLRVELRYFFFFRRRKEVTLVIFDYLKLYLCRGILHPKLH